MNVQMAGGEMCSSGGLSVAKVTLELCTYPLMKSAWEPKPTWIQYTHCCPLSLVSKNVLFVAKILPLLRTLTSLRIMNFFPMSSL